MNDRSEAGHDTEVTRDLGASGQGSISTSLWAGSKHASPQRDRKYLSTRKKFLVLALIMIIACGVSLTIMTILLYRNNIEEHREQLQVTAQSQARLIEAVARYDSKMADLISYKNPNYNAFTATLSQIIDAHEQFGGFGETGEFTLARREGGSIVFLLRHRHMTVESPKSISIDMELAEPMRLALKGLSGTVIGLDYRGEIVLAAHEPIAFLDLGIVAKIDLAEIRAPFIRAGLSAIAVALLVILAGTVLFFRISNPIIEQLESYSRNLEKEVEEHTVELTAANEQLTKEINGRKRTEESLRESEERYRTVVQDQTELISRFREDGTFIFVNEVYCRFFNKTHEELIGKHWQPVVVQEELPAIEEKLVTMSVENPIVLTENRVFSGSGEIRWMQFVNRGFFDDEGQRVEIQSVGRDITELKLVEGALKRSEKTLKQISSRRLDAFEEERKRISLELHDGLAQTMGAIKIWAESAQMHYNKNNEVKIAESMDKVVSLVQIAIEELRRISRNLHPVTLENLGLKAAIDWLCEEFEQLDRSINITRQIDEIGNEVLDSLKIAIFRVTQEALNNVFKHSKANLVRISLQKEEREIKLIIEDDGSGFNLDSQNLDKKDGIGLGVISMEERTNLSGGIFTIESQILKGTTVKAVWPL